MHILVMSLGRIVFQKFFDQIHVCHDHAPTAVSSASNSVQRLTIRYFLGEESNVWFPKIGDNLVRMSAGDWKGLGEMAYLAAWKAANWNDHFRELRFWEQKIGGIEWAETWSRKSGWEVIRLYRQKSTNDRSCDGLFAIAWSTRQGFKAAWARDQVNSCCKLANIDIVRSPIE